MLASSRKRVLRGVGRPSPRSVDSQTESLDIEPRNLSSRREPSLLAKAGAAPTRLMALACRSHRGRRPRRTVTRVPQEPGRSAVSCIAFIGTGVAEPKAPGSPGMRLLPGGANGRDAMQVSLGERNEPARRAAEVGVSSKYQCSGRTNPWEPVKGKEGTLSQNRWRETWRGHRTSILCQRDDNG